MIPALAIILLLFLLLSLMSAAEMSLVRLRMHLIAEGDEQDMLRDKRLAHLIDRADRIIRHLALLKVLLVLGIGFSLVPLLFELVGEWTWYSAVPVLLVVLALHELFVRLLPLSWAEHKPEAVLKRSFLPLRLLMGLVAPLLWLSEVLENWLYKRMDIDSSEDAQMELALQVHSMETENPELSPVMRQIMKNALSMRELDVSDILLPRNQVQYFDLEDVLEDNLSKARATGHTRFPLCEGDLDHCIGIIHIKDIFRLSRNANSVDLRAIRRDITRLPAETRLEVALQRLLRLRMHMALVVDEFGGTVGVVTLETILEELVGDIQDEFDYEEALIQKLSADQFRVSGLAPIHEVEEMLGLEIENEEVSTFGGLVTAEIGRIPERSERFELEAAPLEIVIEEVNERRIISTRVRRVERKEVED